MKKMFILALAVTMVLAIAGSVMAGTATTSFTVQTNTIANCKITKAASTVDFGSYDPTSGTDNDTGAGSFGFKCTKGTTYKIYITGARAMTSGSETLNFELYSDSGRSAIFPSTNAAGISGNATSNGVEILTNIYGRIPKEQDVTASLTFNQTLIATVDY